MEDLSSLSAGDYTTTVVDANGCEIVDTVEVHEPDPLTTHTTTTDVLCNGDSSGTANICIQGGTAPYVINWNGVDPNSGWIHCSYKRDGSNRGNCLTALKQKGKVKYVKGLMGI